MGSQIPVYYTHGYSFSYLPRARDGFYPRNPWTWVFLPPLQTTFLFVEDTYQLVGIMHNTCKVWGSNPDITTKKKGTYHLSFIPNHRKLRDFVYFDISQRICVSFKQILTMREEILFKN